MRHTYACPPPPGLPSLLAHILHWSRLWNQGHLHTFVTIRYSRRLTRSIGRCHPQTGQIWLSLPLLEEHPHELLATLCHEAAHVAVYLEHGTRARPHGPEWRRLMQAAGYPAERVLRLPCAPESPDPKRGSARRIA